MIAARRAGAATAAWLMAAALLVAAAPQAQGSASPGWRIVSTHRFGGSPAYSSLDSVVSTGMNNAWAFGGADLVGPAGGTPVAEHWNGRSWRATANTARPRQPRR